MDWPPPRDKWFPGFTAHPRGGWVRSYAGRAIWCGGRNATRDEAEKTFGEKREALDRTNRLPRRDRTYREVLSEFLDACERRVATGKPRPMRPRTLHNLTVILNQLGEHVGGGSIFAHTNRPEVFAAFAVKFGAWKASGYDSVVCRVGSLYRWAVGMEFIDRYRPGPQFQRPAKADIRDERIDLTKSYAPAEFAKLYAAANRAERCMLGLGLFAAMNNSEVANLTRPTVDLSIGAIDFRRRKKGRVRRVIPLPALALADLRGYVRPEPAHKGDADLFFLTRLGHSYSGTRRRDGKPQDNIGRMWPDLEGRAGVTHTPRRNFSGLRTTFFNLAPRAGYDLERAVIMGRAKGTVDLDSYLEEVGLDRLRHVVSVVWSAVSTSLADAGVSTPAPFPAPAESQPPGPRA